MNVLTKETFTCSRTCGRCCIDVVVPLTEQDKARITKKGIKLLDISEQDPFNPRQRVLKKQSNNECVFLEKNKQGTYSCKIYADRPQSCKQYPFVGKKITSCLPKDVYPESFVPLSQISIGTEQ